MNVIFNDGSLVMGKSRRRWSNGEAEVVLFPGKSCQFVVHGLIPIGAITQFNPYSITVVLLIIIVWFIFYLDLRGYRRSDGLLN